ncbi:melA [Symbiodinium sp. CCMP2456]|nr:melA [Symbiodinium sp. CCMP2456]
MEKHLVHFVIWLPRCIFSPTKVENFPLKVRDENGKLAQLDVCHVAEISAQKIQEGQMGPASVVGQYIADQLAGKRRIQRIGKRFCNNGCQDVKGHNVISAFCVNLARLGSVGPLLHKPASAKNIVEGCRCDEPNLPCV